MNGNIYPYSAAGHKLETEAIAQCSGEQQAKYLAALKNVAFHNVFQVFFDQERRQYQLVKEDSDGQREEIVLRLSGIITHSRLPPIMQRPKYPMRLSQSVTLTGLDTNKFEATLEGIALVYGMFSKAMRSGQLDEWNPGIYQKWRTVSISNTYFSPGTSAPISSTSVPFHPLVDPAGVLASLVEDGHLHAADNDVGYFERVPREESGFKYNSISPRIFSMGDIVEARVSFVAVPVSGSNGKRFKLVMVLRSLALIDDTFTKEATLALAQSILSKPKKTLKRSAQFSEDESEGPRKSNQSTRMTVDG